MSYRVTCTNIFEEPYDSDPKLNIGSQLMIIIVMYMEGGSFRAVVLLDSIN